MRRARIPGSLITFATIILILSASVIVILYGRGYRFDITKQSGSSIKPTGLLSATSDPIASQVLVDNILRSATNNSFAIDPGWYTVTIAKEGYISWQKQLRVQGEVVTRADAFLFPKNPSLSPLTTTGLLKPTLSPDGNKIAYLIPQTEDTPDTKIGLWVYELAEGPLGRNRDPQHIGITDGINLETADITWSADSTSILLTQGSIARLYQTNRPNSYTVVTSTLSSLRADWETERIDKQTQQLSAFPEPFIAIATTSSKLIAFSPDETKILYLASAAATLPPMIDPPLIGTNPTPETRTIEPGNIYVYDSKEDKNFLLLSKSELPTPSLTPSPTKGPKAKPSPQQYNTTTIQQLPLHWFPTSNHLILTLPGKIDIMEYDRTNWVTVYAGPFEQSFIAPWNNGSRIIIMTTLNPNGSRLPNLYTVNLR